MPSKSIVIVAGGFAAAASGLAQPLAAEWRRLPVSGSAVRSAGSFFSSLLMSFAGGFGSIAGRSPFWFRRLVRLGNRHLIALRREGMLHILTQSHRVDVGGAISRIVELNLRNLRRKLAIAQEVEIVSLRIPGRIVGIEHVVGNAVDLPVRGAPDVDGGEAIAD